MELQSFPFTSQVTYDINGLPQYDRAVDSKILRNVFKSYWTDGVFAISDSNSMQVVAPIESGMFVTVKKGACQIQGAVGINENNVNVELEPADTHLPRIDTIALRFDDNQEYRNIRIIVIKGTPATNPVEPELTRTGSIHDIGIANVYVRENVGTIVQLNITDTRPNQNRCGYVTSQQPLDTQSLYSQFQGSIDDIISTMNDVYDQTLLGNIDSRVEVLENDNVFASSSKAGKVKLGETVEISADGTLNVKKPTEVNTTLLATNWDGTKPYSYSLPVTGVTPTSNQEIIPATTITEDQLDSLAGAKVIGYSQDTNQIILRALGEKPTIDIPVTVILRGEK